MEPIEYTIDLLTPIYYYIPVVCTQSVYDGSSCKVKHSGLPVGVDIPSGFTENTSDSELLTAAYVQENASLYNTQILELESQQNGENSAADEASDVDFELALVNKASKLLWKNAVRQFMADTLGTISTEEMQSLLSEFQPEGIERFAYYPFTGEWIRTGYPQMI